VKVNAVDNARPSAARPACDSESVHSDAISNVLMFDIFPVVLHGLRGI
jgi:hypothetical protein